MKDLNLLNELEQKIRLMITSLEREKSKLIKNLNYLVLQKYTLNNFVAILVLRASEGIRTPE